MINYRTLFFYLMSNFYKLLQFPTMELLFFSFLIFLSSVRSQALLSVLQQQNELTTLIQFVNNSQSLKTLLSSADNVTLFAPSNAAFEAWFPNQSPTLTEDQIEALLMYHLVHGVFPSVEFSNEPQFSRSFLTNTSYVNITGGQRVELVTNSSGNPAVFSGNKIMSGISRTVRYFDPEIEEVPAHEMNRM
jgi:hypothetical protein